MKEATLLDRLRTWLRDYVGIHMHDWHPWSEPITNKIFERRDDPAVDLPIRTYFIQQRSCKECAIVKTRRIKRS